MKVCPGSSVEELPHEFPHENCQPFQSNSKSFKTQKEKRVKRMSRRFVEENILNLEGEWHNKTKSMENYVIQNRDLIDGHASCKNTCFMFECMHIMHHYISSLHHIN